MNTIGRAILLISILILSGIFLLSQAQASETPVASSITVSGFHAPTAFGANGTDYVWFNANFKPSGVTDGSTIYLTNSSITITLNGVTQNVMVPNAVITFSKNATSTTTYYDSNKNAWITTAPLSGTDDIFLSGMLLNITPNELPQNSQVTWTAYFSTNTPGVSLNWKYGAAVYTNAPMLSNGAYDYNAIGVKASHNHASGYNNGDQAGTPENLSVFTPFTHAICPKQ